jgi:hypothetical protein
MIEMVKVRQRVALFVAGFAYMGCSAQAEPDYQGEPLATVFGTVVTTDAPPSGEIEAALLWNSNVPSDLSLRIASTRVRGSFPAAFTLEVLAPPPPVPPEPLGQAQDGVRVGYIAAIKHQSGPTVRDVDIVGVAIGFLVLYFPNDSRNADDLVAFYAKLMNVPPTRGYHLAKVTVTEDSEAPAVRCEYDGVCEHGILGYNGSTDGTPEEQALEHAIGQAKLDRDFALCTKYLPDAPRCDIAVNTFDDYPTDGACQALVQARNERQQERVHAQGEAAFCPVRWLHVANPDEFATPVTIKLGTRLYEAQSPTAASFQDQPSE